VAKPQAHKEFRRRFTSSGFHNSEASLINDKTNRTGGNYFPFVIWIILQFAAHFFALAIDPWS
jgi:hypothetical protein